MKTAFWTPFGRYHYLRKPFGVSLAPEEFECKLHKKLHVDDIPGVVVLLDNVLVMGYGDSQEEAVIDSHDENLVRLLQRARETDLKLNKSKINLTKMEVKFMGHVITNQGLKPDPDKVKAVEVMPRPT